MSEELTRQEMLPIMERCGVLDHLDINEEDFLGGHGRERFYVAVIQEAYTAGRARALLDVLEAASRTAGKVHD